MRTFKIALGQENFQADSRSRKSGRRPMPHARKRRSGSWKMKAARIYPPAREEAVSFLEDGRGKNRPGARCRSAGPGRKEKKEKAGGGLLSRLEAVPSALGRLTSVFGTGTGISAPPWPPA